MIYGERDLQRIALAVMGDDGKWHIDDTTGVLDPGATLTRRFAKATTATALAVTGASSTVYTPPAGKRPRLKWIALSTASNQAETIATVLIGGSTHYQWVMSSPGAFMRTSVREGAVNDTLLVNLSVPSATVYVNYEVDPF